MRNIFVVLVALFVCTLSKSVDIAWDCTFHTRMTTNTSSEYTDIYRIMHDGYTAYMMNIVHAEAKVYYTYAAFDLKQVSYKNYPATKVTNVTGTCEVRQGKFGGIHSSFFEYTTGPEIASCPNGNKNCRKYCDDTLCIILDSKKHVVEEIYLKSSIVYYYTFLDDVPALDMFSVECNGNTYTPTDYCPLKTINLATDCTYHTRITTNTSSEVTDYYRIMHDGYTAYMMSFTHTSSYVYYTYAAFDMNQMSYKNYPATKVTNMTGTCEVKQTKLGGCLTSYFLCSNDPKDVSCPDGTTGCKKYCDDTICIIVDSNQRLVEEIYLKNSEEYYYTYLDDVPALDMFSVECNGNTYTPTDYCPLKTINLAMNCTYHTRITTNTSSEVTDHYRIMHDEYTAYMMNFVHTSSYVYYTYAAFDMNQMSYKNYPATMVTNMTGTCEVKQTKIGGSHSSYFLCPNDPKDVSCPDSTTGCKKYCDDTICIIVDSNQRLVEEIYLKNSEEYYISYLDEVPSIDIFTVECDGESYPATDYCAENSNSSDSGSSSSNSFSSHGSSVSPVTPTDVSVSSVTKAAITVVLAEVIVALL